MRFILENIDSQFYSISKKIDGSNVFRMELVKKKLIVWPQQLSLEAAGTNNWLNRALLHNYNEPAEKLSENSRKIGRK